jgi:competence protein ComEA
VNSFKKTIRNFFGTTRAQTNGFVGLLFVVTFTLFSQPLTRWWISTRAADFSKEQAELDSLTRLWSSEREEKQQAEETKREITYFRFDPNTATKDEFISLSFSDKLAVRIINYRDKGGKFRIKSDLLKLYGMDSAFYARLESYILLPDKKEKPKVEKKEFAAREKPVKEKLKFNLNEADTLQLEKIYGIGPALAKRITKYRDKLGGFTTQEQLKEVYGLDTSVVKRIISASYLPDPADVKKINLNTVDEKTLAAHPYFGRKIASAIVAYRFQHGNFKSVDDLSRIPLIDKNNLGKLFPYATVDP